MVWRRAISSNFFPAMVRWTPPWKLWPRFEHTSKVHISKITIFFSALLISVEVAYKRFGDNIPKQIDTDFVRGLDNGLDLALRYMDISTERCLQWLQESPAIVQRRNELRGKKKRLENAKEKLGPALRL
jgi:hypothetical protein